MENMSGSSEKVAVPVSTAAVQPRPVIAGAVPIRPAPVLIRPANLAPGVQPRPVVLIRPSPRPTGGGGGVLSPQSRTFLTRPPTRIISLAPSQGSPKIAPPIKTEPPVQPQPLAAKPSASAPNLLSSPSSSVTASSLAPRTPELVTNQTPVATLLRNAPISMKLEAPAPASSITAGGNSTFSRPVIHRLLASDLKTISTPAQSTTSASLQQQPNRKVTREMQVRVCKRRDRRFSVLRYNAYDRLDLSGSISSGEASSSKGSGNQEVFLRRENNLRQFKAANNIIDFPTRGAGSEFGQEAKEEARLRRLGVSRQGYRAEDQPWLLTVGKGSAAKRYRGVREGNVSANVRYFIFCQTKDGNFDAYPVHEWYKLNPEVSYRYLRDEEAEMEYSRRHKTMNLFNVMVKRKLVDDTTEEGLSEAKEANARIKAGLAASAADAAAKAEAKGTNGSGVGGSKRSRSFLLTELDEWNELSDEEEEDEDEEEEGKGGAEGVEGDDGRLLGSDGDDEGVGGGRAGGARGGKKSKTAAARRKQRAAAIVARKRRGIKQRKRRRKNAVVADSSDEEDDANEEAWDESEPDDHEGDEVDYITDSSSDEEKLSADEREQIYQETGVDEEQGLKALLTDISDSDENQDESKRNETHDGDEGAGASDRDGSDDEAAGRKRTSKSSRDGEGGNGSREDKRKRHRHHHHRSSKVDENESSSGSSDDDEDASSSSSSSSSSDDDDDSSDSDFDMAPDDPERLARKAQKKAEMMRKISDKVSPSKSIAAAAAVTGSPASKDSSGTPPTATSVTKRPAETGATEEETEGGAAKRLKTADNAATPAAEPAAPPPDDELTAHVRKYLMRKPITVTELLKKIRVKKLVPKTDDAQTLLANALRRLRPIKQIINGQHVLSLKR
ncbi:General transcription factor IIF subunit 1 [Sparganum proliferum]